MSGISDTQFAVWLDQVADGLDAGMTSSGAVAMARSLPRAASRSLADAFESGRNWGDALAEIETPFSQVETTIVGASEWSATLPGALRRLANARRQRAVARNRVLRSLLYPTFLLHFAALAFSATYLVDGPPYAFAVSAGRILVPFWATVGLMALALRLYPQAMRKASRMLPFFSAYRRNWDASVFCDTLASCLKAGLRAETSWEAAVAAADDPRIDKMGTEAIKSISAGAPASEGIARGGPGLPGGFQQLYRSGETTGNLEQSLEAAAKRYASDALAKLTVATMLYPNLLLAGIYGYVAYRIIQFFQSYYQGILDMANG